MRAITGPVPTMKLASSSQIKHLVSEVDATLQKILKLVGTIAGYAGCNENFVLLTTGITGVLSFEL